MREPTFLILLFLVSCGRCEKSVNTDEKLVFGTNGKSGRLTCRSWGEPLNMCLWRKVGTESIEASFYKKNDPRGRYTKVPGLSLSDDNGFDKGVCSLKINSLTKEHEGEWKCILMTVDSDVYKGFVNLILQNETKVVDLTPQLMVMKPPVKEPTLSQVIEVMDVPGIDKIIIETTTPEPKRESTLSPTLSPSSVESQDIIYNKEFFSDKKTILIGSQNDSFDGWSYLIPQTPLSWFNGFEYCKVLGKELMSIDSEKEYKFIAELIRRSGINESERYWTSGSSIFSKEGSFTWMSTGQRVAAMFWAPEYPIKEKSNNFCAAFFLVDEEYKLKNVPCDTNSLFVCKERLHGIAIQQD